MESFLYRSSQTSAEMGLMPIGERRMYMVNFLLKSLFLLACFTLLTACAASPTKVVSLPELPLITSTNAARLEAVHVLQGPSGQVVAFAFTPDELQLISLSSDSTLIHWDVASGQKIQSRRLGGGPFYNGAFSLDAAVFAVEGPDRLIQLRDSQDGRVLKEFSGHSSFVMSFTFSADDRFLATGDDGGFIKVWGVENGLLLQELAAHPGSIGSLAFSPDDSLLASGGVEGSTAVNIWDLSDGRLVISLQKHTGNVYDLAFSPDGSLLASASGDRTIRLWDTSSWEQEGILQGHDSFIYSVAFSPDGSLLASSDFNGNLKLWDVTGRRQLVSLHGHTDLVQPLLFSSSGSLLASGSFDGTIILWGFPPALPTSDTGAQ
jgi:WD40 repeat protein